MQGYEVEDDNGGRAWWDGKKLTPLDANGFQVKPQSGGGGGQGGGLSPQERKAMEDMRNAAINIRGAREQAFEFVKRNAKTGTGGVMAIPGVSEVVGAVNPDVAAMQGISNAMIPSMHVTPGPMTDADAKMYRSAIPNPNLPGPANMALAKDTSRKEQQIAARLAFFQSYAKRAGTTNGADVAFNRFWSDYERRKKPPPQKGGGNGGGAKYLGTE